MSDLIIRDIVLKAVPTYFTRKKERAGFLSVLLLSGSVIWAARKTDAPG